MSTCWSEFFALVTEVYTHLGSSHVHIGLMANNQNDVLVIFLHFINCKLKEISPKSVGKSLKSKQEPPLPFHITHEAKIHISFIQFNSFIDILRVCSLFFPRLVFPFGRYSRVRSSAINRPFTVVDRFEETQTIVQYYESENLDP